LKLSELLEEFEGWDPTLQVVIQVDLTDDETIENGDLLDIEELRVTLGRVHIVVVP
jgi:hypothetical protein